MKKVIQALILTVSIMGAQSAFAFFAPVKPYISPTLIGAQIFNPTGAFISCTVTVQGLLDTGYTVGGNIIENIAPGGSVFVPPLTPPVPPLYFVNGSVVANCI